MSASGGSFNWAVAGGVAVALPLTILAAYWVYALVSHPFINDISTDLDQPPVFRRMPASSPHPGEAVAQQQRKAYPDVVPLRVGVPPQRAFGAVLSLLRERGWKVVAVDDAGLRVEATSQSRIFRFVDEIAVRVTDGPEGARIDMRSRSRVGRSDLGVNAKRIRAFLADLEVRLGTKR